MKPRVVWTIWLGAYLSMVTGGWGIEGPQFRIKAPGGWVTSPNNVTLVVSQPDAGKLIYYNTATNEELKEVEVDFQPGAMALQGNTLFVAGRGSSIVYALDPKTGKTLKQYPLGSDAASQLACHPTKGLLYASTAAFEVYSLDAQSGKVTKTDATGNFLAVDPQGRYVYTGVQPPRDEKFVIKTTPGGGFKIIWDDWGVRAAIMKYEVKGKDLTFVAAQKNAAVNGWSFHLTPDGQRVMMTGGGGWRPPVEGGTGGGYVTAVFSAENLQSMVGQAPHASNIAFHPVLKLGVANQQGRELTLFNSKSLAEQGKITVASGADMRPLLLAFGAKGTKVILWNGDNPQNPAEGLWFIPLDLTKDQRSALEDVYGALPPPPAKETPEVAKEMPEPAPAKQAKPSQVRPSVSEKLRPREPPANDPSPSKAATAASAPRGSQVASAGFNSRKGMNTRPGRRGPYPVGKANQPGGEGEPGWAGTWPASDKAEFVSDVVKEGDGALKLTGTVNYGRPFARPLFGKIEVETYVNVPPGGDLKCYLWKTNAMDTGPIWMVVDSEFHACDGDGQGSTHSITGIRCEPDRWYKVTLLVDVKARTWEMLVDDKKVAGKPLGFRCRPDVLAEINFLCETPGGAYIDAIRIVPTR